MSIKERIQELVLTFSPNFYYGRKSDINIQGDNASFPAIILIEPDEIGFSVSTDYGTIKDTETCFVQFVDIVTMGEQAIDRVQVINDMRLLAATFVNSILSDPIIELQQAGTIGIKGVLVVDKYDVNVAGIEIQLPLRLILPKVIC